MGEESYGPGDWSDLFELHWSDNPERELDEAYGPITVGRDDVTYVDLIVYHTRLTLRSNTLQGPGRIPADAILKYRKPEIGTVITFYTKPFIRGDLPDNPCGWNPGVEYHKIPPQTRDTIRPDHTMLYEVEILVVCDNAQAKASLYMVILHDSDNLAIYAWPGLNELKEALKQGIDEAERPYTGTRGHTQRTHHPINPKS